MMIAALLLALAPQQYAPVNATMAVGPTADATSTGVSGGPFTPASSTFTVSNSGIETLSWTAASSANWLTLSSSSGTLATRKAKSITFTLDADAEALAPGNYTSTLTFTNVTNGIGTTTRTYTLTVLPAPLTPGAEWGGATAEPGQIGTGTAKCIARWDVVPHQVITEATTPTFTVGVVAFHIAGIEKVSFAVEGGAFVDVTEMSLNPFTNVWEYCATITLSDFAADEEIEFRAIAYPKAAAPQAAGTGAYAGGGYPRLLDSLFLWVDADAARTPLIKYASVDSGSDSTGDGTEALPYKTIWKAAQAIDAAGGADDANGGFVYLDGGNYTWDQPGGGTLPPTSTRWLTIQPKPGVMPWQVEFNTLSVEPGLGIHKVRLRGVTVKKNLAAASPSSTEWWADTCIFVGANNGIPVNFRGFLGQGKRYFTDCEQYTESTSYQGEIVRNCYSERTSYGVGGKALYVNNIYTEFTDFGNPDIHPDWCTWNFRGSEVQDNGIVYGNVGLNMNAQGYFWKDTATVQNIAIVNNVSALTGFAGSPFGGGACDTLNHFLFWNNTHSGVWQWYDVNQIAFSNVSVRGNWFTNMSEAFGGPPQDSWFDQNHITGGQWNTITPGTNVTTGDPGLDANFRPLPTSVLRSRLTSLLVPIDADGQPRTSPGTVGAYE